MYGCVTNGYEWCFLKLENSCVLIDTERFFLNDLAHILGVFQLIITQANQNDTSKNLKH